MNKPDIRLYFQDENGEYKEISSEIKELNLEAVGLDKDTIIEALGLNEIRVNPPYKGEIIIAAKIAPKPLKRQSKGVKKFRKERFRGSK